MENDGGLSPRLKFFAHYHGEYTKLRAAGEFDHTLMNGGETAFNPRYLSVGLSNKCNLSCRMCFPNLSSKVARDVFQYRESTSEGQNEFIPRTFFIAEKLGEMESVSFREQYREFQKKFDFLDDDRYWEQIDRCVPFLDQLFLHGGEPLLSAPKIDALVDRILELKRETSIELRIVTNLAISGFPKGHKYGYIRISQRA